MRTGFKEWAVVVDALGLGEQILILRKGGISEGRGGFQVERDQFLLVPTLFHQQRESVIAAAQARFDMVSEGFPPADLLRIEYFAQVVRSQEIHSIEAAHSLRGQHIWRDEVIGQRFDWGKGKNIFALIVRVFRLHRPAVIPALPKYGGCKSWIELDVDVPAHPAVPVLSDAAFQAKVCRSDAALEPFREARGYSVHNTCGNAH